MHAFLGRSGLPFTLPALFRGGADHIGDGGGSLRNVLVVGTVAVCNALGVAVRVLRLVSVAWAGGAPVAAVAELSSRTCHWGGGGEGGWGGGGASCGGRGGLGLCGPGDGGLSGSSWLVINACEPNLQQ